MTQAALMPNAKTKLKRNIMLSDEVFDRIVAAARENDRTISAQIERVLREWLDNRQADAA